MPVLEGLSDRRYRVGGEAGMGQALKLSNNFLSATASGGHQRGRRVRHLGGHRHGDHARGAERVERPERCERGQVRQPRPPGTFASGFANTLMAKDVQLYLDAIDHAQAGSTGNGHRGSVEAVRRTPSRVDFTEIYTYTTEG